ncbi:beta-ketoacyl-ACP synthase II [Oenococcus oeni]|uniref:beta-ketoacyl-ACP synthase II n=1 Tax=Oenococcus oeni TaxID=1247 RepID=UPI000277B1B7|nr:beta-ketoacyl-ACP synthase II [Oenococcus oeni]AVI94739.1 beta-ketoacyl-[acyl-carrier-protein] synthase II [Oenococcus oeni]EJO03317.1 3-oxoacyl-[acyl-carrier-protein] synthase II [Oenococcus oeni AWRIB418]OIM38793.1 beta-ketoacyl-[acyl-carrier-protein] synthase II [Oenococcus oeni]QGR01968.1 beta-ketoacyl-[acyl-carrier-protein] synthase II [Oenococcus oeni]TEU24440.1 beta-ketoacyl-[acyl-carrier-protein] synthase II [Oenococcus oeni]
MTRVVITGMGAVTPLGSSVNEFVSGLRKQQVGFRPISTFDSSATGVTLAGEAAGFDPLVRLSKKDLRRMDRFSQFAVYSALEAYQQAGLEDQTPDPERFGVIYGSGIGGLTTIQEQVIRMHDLGADRVSPMFVPTAIANMAAGNLAIRFHAQNICMTIVTACSSGANAIGEAFRAIESGRADIMLTGGSEASINEIGIGGFAALSTLSKATDPTKASLPFDKNRNGFVMGEGGGTLILESLEHAQKRGAEILGELVGYGASEDAYHITSPDPAGTQAARAMRLAIEEAGLKAEQIGYINAHGTATHGNDFAEAAAINQVFSKDQQVLVSSSKSMTGHLLGAAGAIEAVATVSALRDGQLPVNVGITEQDPECQVNLVTEENAQTEVDYALSNSFGFGGHNAVLAFKKWSD